MAMPYVGEIRIFAGNFAPAGWMLCHGQLLPISEYETLFQLIGTTYGGDGQSTFGLPDMRGRLPTHQGNGMVLAERGGAESVTLLNSQLPNHNHTLLASGTNGNEISPENALLANSFNITPYINDVGMGIMNIQAITSTGGNQSHNNLQPFLCLNFIISLYGIFPSPT